MTEKKPDSKRASLAWGLAIAVGLIIGIFIKRVHFGLIIGILLGLFSSSMLRR